jgi:thymidylate synthase
MRNGVIVSTTGGSRKYKSADDQYKKILLDVLDYGDSKGDRTGTGTIADWGARARFDLSEGKIPILTLKRVYWKTAIRELLWMLSGTPLIRPLLEQDVHIWSEWPWDKYVKSTGDNITLKEFEQRVLSDDDFSKKYGTIGSGYGVQWTSWDTGKKCKTCRGLGVLDDAHCGDIMFNTWTCHDCKGHKTQKIDQIADVVNQIKNNPNSRRILFHAWNVPEIPNMALPPCHLLYQYQVTSDGKLNSIMYQRK